MKLKNLIRSYSFWTTLAGALCILMSALGRAFSFKVEEKIISDIVMAIAGVLVAVGIVSMPAKKEEEENAASDLSQESQENSDAQDEEGTDQK